jgi:hypothetical protein
MSGDHEAAPAELYDGYTHVADSPSTYAVVESLEDAVGKDESDDLSWVDLQLASAQVRRWPGDALKRVWGRLLGAMEHSSSAEVCKGAA